MNHARTQPHLTTDIGPGVHYRSTETAQNLLDESGTLAVFGFGAATQAIDDPRFLAVPLCVPCPQDSALLEQWHLDAEVTCGRLGALQWSLGGGWLFAALSLDEREHGGLEITAEHAYAQLCAFLSGRKQNHVQRLWNYLGRINEGLGDEERYKRFCAGRLRGMGNAFDDGFPAATAVGHRADTTLLQVYCLAAEQPGVRIENPRQISAWRYPRQYGPTPPSFARAMLLGGETSLAISGTASITGHQSRHHDDLRAQLTETLANLRALLRNNDLPEHFGANDPLKVYVRHAEHVDAVDAFLAEHLPEAPRLLLLGDVCRSELLVEIDGWRFA